MWWVVVVNQYVLAGEIYFTQRGHSGRVWVELDINFDLSDNFQVLIIG